MTSMKAAEPVSCYNLKVYSYSFTKYHLPYLVLIEKDRNPKWKPAKVEDVTDETVDNYFSPLKDTKELDLKSHI